MGVIIEPYVGISFYGKTINFNMSQKDIIKIFGEKAPKINIDNIMGVIEEYRAGMILTYKNKKLADITFTSNVDLYINGIELFKGIEQESNTKDKVINKVEVLKKLEAHDIPTDEGKNGYMNFYKLGICIGGFGKRKIPEKILVTAFSEERIKFYEFFIKM
jgi:hypothetical protein